VTRSNTFTLLCVLIRAGAALFFAGAMVKMLGVFAAMRTLSDGDYPFGTFFAGIGLTMFVALLFWLFPDWLARVALARKTGETFDSDLDADSWQALVNGAVGLLFIGDGLNALVRDLTIALINVRRGGGAALPDDFGPATVEAIATLAFGLGLLLGARGLARWLRRLRGREAEAAQSA